MNVPPSMMSPSRTRRAGYPTRFPRRRDVLGARGAGQFEPTGDVVDVQMCFEHMGDACAVSVDKFGQPVDVALRVDDDCGPAF